MEHVKENNQAIYFHEPTLQEDTTAAFRAIKTLHHGFSLYLRLWGAEIAIAVTIILLQVATTKEDNKFRN